MSADVRARPGRQVPAYAAVARELGAMAVAGLRAQRRRGAGTAHCSLRLAVGRQPDSYATPVLLVSGYGGGRTHWDELERALVAGGFHHLQAEVYDPQCQDIPAIAADLATSCRQALAASGAPRVHLVGHSLGGVVLRYAIQRLGLAAVVGTAITIASPHRGTRVAVLGRGPVAAALRPGSALLAQLASLPSGDVRWVTCFSNLDLVVPPATGRLPAGDAAVEVLVPDQGHLAILRAPLLVRSVVDHLAADERSRSLAPGRLPRARRPVEDRTLLAA